MREELDDLQVAGLSCLNITVLVILELLNPSWLFVHPFNELIPHFYTSMPIIYANGIQESYAPFSSVLLQS